MHIYEKTNCKVLQCNEKQLILRTAEGYKILIHHNSTNIREMLNKEVDVKYILDLLHRAYKLINMEKAI